MTDLLTLVAGVLLAAVGGEFFVRGAIGISARARVPARLVGTTIAAFATSSPEMSVAIQAARAGEPAIALGDALGSNVINLALVLGVALALGEMHIARAEVRRELTVAAIAPVLTVAVLIDGQMVRAEAAVLLTTFVVWLISLSRQALRDRTPEESHADAPNTPRALGAACTGLVALILAGRLIVEAAKGIGGELGLDPFVVGATLVAVGTSVPELATAVVSRLRGHAEVGLGAALGSNVFNNLWIVGLAGIINPMKVAVSELVVAVTACLLGLLLAVPRRDGRLRRWRGGSLLCLFAAYCTATVILGTT